MKSSIIKNLSWVLACSVITKLIGGVYRVVLTRILGESIGLYQMVFSVYSFLTILITSGISMSASKLISSKKRDVDKQGVVCGIMFILLTVSLILAIILILASRGLALLQGEIKIYICYIILAPSLIFSAGCAVLRGYYQGCEQFSVSAMSNVFEQFARVAFSLVLMLVLQKYYVLGALIGCIGGNVVGDLVAFVYLKLRLKKIRLKNLYRYVDEGKKVLKHSYLIMLYSILLPFSNLIDGFLIVKLLNINYTRPVSVFLYGLQSGVVGSLISIPNIFSFALVSVLMPALSSSYSNKNLGLFKDRIKFSFKLILFVAVPCAIFFMINSADIIKFIYGRGFGCYGVDGVCISKNLLVISSIGIVFSGVSQLSSVILQNINKKSVPIINLGIGLISKLLLELVFVPTDKFGVYAYAVAVALSCVISGVLNLYAVKKFLYNIIDFKFFGKLTASCSVLVLVMVALKVLVPSGMFVLSSMFTITVYFIIIYLFKLFSKKDIKIFINK